MRNIACLLVPSMLLLESGNEGGSPQIRERHNGFGYAVFVPVGAVVVGVVGGIIGARKQ